MKLLVFRTVYLHTKNELPVNYETVWSRTTRVGRACTYAQKFRNELFTKFILYFSWKWESLENSSCAKKDSPVNSETIRSRSTRVGKSCTYAQKFYHHCLLKSNCAFHEKWLFQKFHLRTKMSYREMMKLFDLSQLASTDLVLPLKSLTISYVSVNFSFPCVCRNSLLHTKMCNWESMKLFDV